MAGASIASDLCTLRGKCWTYGLERFPNQIVWPEAITFRFPENVLARYVLIKTLVNRISATKVFFDFFCQIILHRVKDQRPSLKLFHFLHFLIFKLFWANLRWNVLVHPWTAFGTSLFCAFDWYLRGVYPVDGISCLPLLIQDIFNLCRIVSKTVVTYTRCMLIKLASGRIHS